jgi:glycosyltransferase involved in cell wall biosynthesis
MVTGGCDLQCRVSVLLPVFNGARFLPEALRSLDAQSESGFEIIAVDDGSTDDSAQVLGGAPRVKLLSQPHHGLVAALNHGLAHARGKYIARMDADDIAASDRLKAQADYLDANPTVGLVAGGANYLGDDEANRGLALFVDWANSLRTPHEISVNRFVESPLIHPTVMFRRELVEQHSGYKDGPFPEDYELWLRWLEAGVQMAKVDATVLEWRDRADRLTRSDERYSVDAFYRAKAPYLARWLARHNPHHPRVIVWGSGRTSRQRLNPLLAEGIEVEAYVDIDPNKTGWKIDGVPVMKPAELASPNECFVLQWVGSRGARELIQRELEGRGFEIGKNFMLCA